MKNYSNIFLFSICIYVLTSCNCKTCKDNITEANMKIPYKDKDVVFFINDTLGIISDTVRVQFGGVSKASYDCYSSSGDAERNFCNSLSGIQYSNYFQIQIFQAPNSSNNIIIFKATQIFGVTKTDSVLVSYKNEQLKAIHFYNPVDSFGSQIWKLYKFKNADSTFVYNDYYYTTDKTIKLLQYSKVFKDGKRRVYRLKE